MAPRGALNASSTRLQLSVRPQTLHPAGRLLPPLKGHKGGLLKGAIGPLNGRPSVRYEPWLHRIFIHRIFDTPFGPNSCGAPQESRTQQLVSLRRRGWPPQKSCPQKLWMSITHNGCNIITITAVFFTYIFRNNFFSSPFLSNHL